MEVLGFILALVMYIVCAIFIGVPLVSWWINLLRARKMKKQLKDGGIDINALNKHIK